MFSDLIQDVRNFKSFCGHEKFLRTEQRKGLEKQFRFDLSKILQNAHFQDENLPIESDQKCKI